MVRLTIGDPHRPGLRRRRQGRGFRYFDATGRPIDSPAELARLRALAIPPAWTDVWICPHPRGHLQALGTDAAGRRQYLYHPDFRRLRELAKHEHVLEFAERLPQLRSRVADDLAGRGLTRPRVLGCAARLLDLGFFRIGSDAYARTNGSYGLTTVPVDHVELHRGYAVFSYPTKSGRHRTAELSDPDALRVVRSLARDRSGGERLLAFRRRPGWQELHGADVNAYLRETTGLDATAKDFRTWHATVLAAVGLAVSTERVGDGEAARRRVQARVVREVADYLGNTPAVCRASYINPRLLELYEEGRTVRSALGDLAVGSAGLPGTAGPVEDAVRKLLLDGA